MRCFLGTALGAALVGGLGCQTYDFEPVTAHALTHSGQSVPVTAKGLPPDFMLLLDRSTSMKERDGSAQTRMKQLQGTLDTFLTSYGQLARIGMVAFIPPGGGACQPATLADIAKSGVDLPTSDDPVELQKNADAVNAAVQKLDANGVGTPTAGSLASLANYTPLITPELFRSRFVILLTDGLPNCNPQNTNNQCMVANTACRCVLTSSNCTSSYDCARGCLDSDATVSAVQTLADKGVQTIVIGFGSDAATGAAPDTLNAIAVAGGAPRSCAATGTDADCVAAGGDAQDGCDTATKLCKKRYYQATNGDKLGQVLKEIVEKNTHPCDLQLSAEAGNTATLSVRVDGVTVTTGPDTWVYSLDGGKPWVHFVPLGAICAKLKASTTVNPVLISIQIVNVL